MLWFFVLLVTCNCVGAGAIFALLCVLILSSSVTCRDAKCPPFGEKLVFTRLAVFSNSHLSLFEVVMRKPTFWFST